MPEISVHFLLKSPTVTIRDVCCEGRCRDKSAEERTAATELVFPYRGVFVRHVGKDQAVAEANQVLFFNAGEGYRVSYGPRPYFIAMRALEEAARAAQE